MIYATDPNLWMQMLDRPVEQRLAPAPEALLDFLAEYEAADGTACRPRPASLPAGFVADVSAALAGLPAAVKHKLEPCLLGVYFVAGLGSSAVSDVVAFGDGSLIGSFVALDVEAMAGRTANQWATWNQNSPFLAAPGLQLSAVIAEAADDDRKAALQFVLLHEFGHVLTAGRDLMPDWWQEAAQFKSPEAYSFLPLSWDIGADGKIVPQAGQDFPLRARVGFYGKRTLPGEHIPEIYRDLEKTQFPSLYGSLSVYEDFAECFATYVHTVLMGRPNTVQIARDGQAPLQFGDFWATPRSERKRAYFDAFFGDLAAAAPDTPYLGLAPFLRMSIAGEDLNGPAQRLLVQANQQSENANLWMNLATAFFSIGQRELGLAIQGQALQMGNFFTLKAAHQPARRRLLALMAPGDLAENTPLDCLLENGDVELLCYYASPEAPLPSPLPAHDALFVAMSDKRDNWPLLKALETLLADWDKPVLNRPEYIRNTDRGRASQLLQGIPGLVQPLTHRVPRATLQAVATGQAKLGDVVPYSAFPIILRPVGSQAGRDLVRIAAAGEIAPYLDQVKDLEFFLARFVDYSGEDGLFRKFRVVLIRGVPYACHMAISTHWMIHYLNAGMYEDAAKRAEEGRFMAEFDAFAQRHGEALAKVYQRFKLDYACIDCAETRAGELLVFEIDHIMVVHAMDSAELFPFKQVHIRKVREAFENLLDPDAGRPGPVRECVAPGLE